MENIRDQFSFKIDVYPKTLSDAYDLLEAHGNFTSRSSKNNNNHNHKNRDDSESEREVSSELQYAQTTEEPIPGADGRFIEHIKCYACNKKGYLADFCPETRSGQTHLQQDTISHVEENNDDTNIEEGVQQLLTHEDINDISDDESETSSIVVEFQAANIHTSFSQRHYGEVDRDTSILIDTGSTCLVFNNEKC